MTLSRLLLTTSLCAAFALPAAAQQRNFDAIDLDGNGSLDLSELEAAFGTAAAARLLQRVDRDSDATLNRDEVRSSRGDDESDDEDDEDDEDDDENDDEDDENDDDDENDESDESDDESDDEDDDESSDESDESDDEDDV